MSVSGGWIKLHRKLLESPLMQHDGLTRLWVYCLMRAGWEERKWLIPGTLIEKKIPRGSFITGRESLYAAMYPKFDRDGQIIKRDFLPVSRTVWRWLEAIEKMGCISLENVSNRATMVSVCNYATYQDVNESDVQADVQPVSNRCPTGVQADVQPVSTNKEVNNLEEIKEEKKDNTSASTPTVEKPKRVRERCHLWDAIVAVTGADQTLKPTAAHIGRVKKTLLAANPPYTAEDVLALPAIAAKQMTWAAGRVLTLGEVEKYIDKVRGGGVQIGASGKPTLMQEIIDNGNEFLRLTGGVPDDQR